MENIVAFDFNMDKSNNYIGRVTCPICGVSIEYHSFEEASTISNNCIHFQRTNRVGNNERTQLQAIFNDN